MKKVKCKSDKYVLGGMPFKTTLEVDKEYEFIFENEYDYIILIDNVVQSFGKHLFYSQEEIRNEKIKEIIDAKKNN